MNKGFSLVELIVVIAIMAILVGVAVPVYTSYIQDAKDGVNEQLKDELERAINTAIIDVQAGLSQKDSKYEDCDSWEVPATIEIANGTVTAKDTDNADCDGFAEVLADLIDLTGVTATVTVSEGVASVTAVSVVAE